MASLYFHIFARMFYTFIFTSLVIKGHSLVKKNVKLLDLLLPAYWEHRVHGEGTIRHLGLKVEILKSGASKICETQTDT